MTESSESKWEGKVTAEVKGKTADQVWPLFADFCKIQKLFHNIEKCDQVEGEEGKPGLVRYVVSAPQSLIAGTDGKSFIWAKEKLVMINPIERCLSYEILENNAGVKAYIGTFKVLPVDGGDGENGCRIEWSIVAEPFEGGVRYEDYESFRNFQIQTVAENIRLYFEVLKFD